MRDALQRDLEARLDGEVHFDKVSRALYSTDASVYQIEPLGVVIVRSRDDILGRAGYFVRPHDFQSIYCMPTGRRIVVV